MATDSAVCRVIGPFLGPIEDQVNEKYGIKIFIALPFGPDEKILRCVIADPKGAAKKSEPIPVSDDDYKLYRFEFHNLLPGESYSYKFLKHDESELDLTGGLTYDHCHFRAPGKYSKDDAFILMSCHNPFETAQGSADEGWAMWEKLLATIDDTVRLLILGGDQVYNDDVEKTHLKTSDATVLRRAFIENYLKYWSEIHYRRVLAGVPSLAMWDDHDITDGWGGRPEQFVSKKSEAIDPKWQRYFDQARDIFAAYQAPRNPTTFVTGGGVFTFEHRLGAHRFLCLDLRSEKNTHRKATPLLSSDHERQVVQNIESINDAETLFVLSPVVPFRCNIGVDARLAYFSRILFNVNRWLCARPLFLVGMGTASATSMLLGLVELFFHELAAFVLATIMAMAFLASIIPKLILSIPDLPTLTDDLEDSLTADCNRPTFIRVLRAMFYARKSLGKDVVMLSGDIHVCGISEIVESRANGVVTIPQIVSSPIAYKPMPKAAEGFSTTTSEMRLEPAYDHSVFARNIFYTSKRNYAQIFPGRIKRPQVLSPVLFHMEGHRLPLAMRTDFTE